MSSVAAGTGKVGDKTDTLKACGEYGRNLEAHNMLVYAILQPQLAEEVVNQLLVAEGSG